MSMDRKKLLELLATDEPSDIARALTTAMQQQAETFIALQAQHDAVSERNLTRMLDFARVAIDAALARGTVDPVLAHTMLRTARAGEGTQVPAHPVQADTNLPEPLDEDELRARIIADTQGRSYGMGAPSGLPGRG